MDNEQSALKRLVSELTQANSKLRTDLANEIGNVVQEFSLDKEDSALSRLVKRVEDADAKSCDILAHEIFMVECSIPSMN